MQVLGTFLILAGFAATGVALWGLIRGHVTWASIPSRQMAGAVLAGSLVVMGVGTAMAPEDEVQVAAGGTTTTTAAPTTTSSRVSTSSSSTTTTTVKTAVLGITARPTTTTTRPPTTTTTRPATTTTTAKVTTTTTTPVQTASCDSHYPDHCIPAAPPDLDCPDIRYTNFRVVGGDPHRFDADKDGIGCEKD
jgi:hypothetical protein